MIVLKRLKFDQKGGNFVTEQSKERKQAYAQQIAQHFHIPRWEQLPSIDLYMDQLLVYMNEHFGGYFACTGASQSGNAPAKCSVRIPINRSILPNTTR